MNLKLELEAIYADFKEPIDQFAHFTVGALVVWLLMFVSGFMVAYLAMMGIALCREVLWQHLIKGHKLGKGSALDLAMFSNGGLVVGLL